MDFPPAYLSLPIRRFPFKSRCRLSPALRPDCHLVRTVIPDMPISDSLGVFHRRPTNSLASFAEWISRSDDRPPHGHGASALFSYPFNSTQGRLLCTQLRKFRFTPQCRFNPASYRIRYPRGVRSGTRTGLRKNRVAGPMPLDCARNLQALGASPQHPPKTGRIKQAPRVSSMCPSEDF